MRNANWHEEGGNARRLKGTEEETLAEHAPPQAPGPKTGRGERAGTRPGHKEALYPAGISRKPGRGRAQA